MSPGRGHLRAERRALPPDSSRPRGEAGAIAANRWGVSGAERRALPPDSSRPRGEAVAVAADRWGGVGGGAAGAPPRLQLNPPWASRTFSSASRSLLQPYNLLVAVLGITLGTVIGVLPGLGGANGVAILLPLTFSMPPTSAHHPAHQHLLGSAVRRGDHLDPVQHPRGALVSGDHVRWLSHGQAW